MFVLHSLSWCIFDIFTEAGIIGCDPIVVLNTKDKVFTIDVGIARMIMTLIIETAIVIKTKGKKEKKNTAPKRRRGTCSVDGRVGQWNIKV